MPQIVHTLTTTSESIYRDLFNGRINCIEYIRHKGKPKVKENDIILVSNENINILDLRFFQLKVKYVIPNSNLIILTARK